MGKCGYWRGASPTRRKLEEWDYCPIALGRVDGSLEM
jgi:hypothetical protein